MRKQCLFLCLLCYLMTPPALNAQSPADEGVRKVSLVLALLPAKTRAAIQDAVTADTAIFLTDLHAVLEADRDGLLLLTDKQHPLPMGYEPPDLVALVPNSAYTTNRADTFLRKPAEESLRRMGNAAAAAGVTLLVSSAYRSYGYQEELYVRYVREMGQTAADRLSAQPGKSQHQLGTTVDFGSISDSFSESRAGEWLLAHAASFGWSLSFPAGYEDVTGYQWESWHYRCIGMEAALFQEKWFGNIQQYLMEFIDVWKKV
ncbi:MAG: M15 family metallopeptidase [Spirochaetaceae bacterium]|jgi:D-alanyl-D-alanine carboxypeptidase|nr:M15 family metallopeptidase [Spirochaetaceae bacterium]